MANPLVTVLVLNWNGDGLIQECLASLRETEYPNVEIVVVDNASTDPSPSFLERQRDVRLIRNDENHGFAKGNNIGFTHAAGEYVVVLNNDMIVEPAWLNDPVHYLDRDDRIGMVACRQMSYNDRAVIDVLYHTLAKDLSFFPYGRGERYSESPRQSRPGFVLGASGGSAVYRKKMLDEIGGFDERFFAYSEDADLSMRAFLHSWKCLYVPGAVVYHRGSATFGKIPEKSLFYGHRNRYLLVVKYFPLSMILSRLPWMLNAERRIATTMCFKQKAASRYLTIFVRIVREAPKYARERTLNLRLLKKRKSHFDVLNRQGIDYLPSTFLK